MSIITPPLIGPESGSLFFAANFNNTSLNTHKNTVSKRQGNCRQIATGLFNIDVNYLWTNSKIHQRFEYVNRQLVLQCSHARGTANIS